MFAYIREVHRVLEILRGILATPIQKATFYARNFFKGTKNLCQNYVSNNIKSKREARMEIFLCKHQ